MHKFSTEIVFEKSSGRQIIVNLWVHTEQNVLNVSVKNISFVRINNCLPNCYFLFSHLNCKTIHTSLPRLVVEITYNTYEYIIQRCMKHVEEVTGFGNTSNDDLLLLYDTRVWRDIEIKNNCIIKTTPVLVNTTFISFFFFFSFQSQSDETVTNIINSLRGSEPTSCRWHYITVYRHRVFGIKKKK